MYLVLKTLLYGDMWILLSPGAHRGEVDSSTKRHIKEPQLLTVLQHPVIMYVYAPFRKRHKNAT